MKKYRRVISHITEECANFDEKLTLGLKSDMRKVWWKTNCDMRNLVNFNVSSGKSEILDFDVLPFSIAYKFSSKKEQKNYLSWKRKKIQTLKTFCLKNNMRNLVNFNQNSGKSENLHLDGLLLQKVCNVWAKKIQTSCVVKNDLWFQK